MKKEFDSKIYTLKLTGKEEKGILNKNIYRIRKAIFSIKYLHGEELTVIQVPFTNDIKFTKNSKHKIAFIHDIEGIRKNDTRIENREINFLNTCEYIVAHNNKMKRYLVKKGIDAQKIYVLELFDYLCNYSIKDNKIFDKNDIKIVYTGNLDKAPFLRQIK